MISDGHGILVISEIGITTMTTRELSIDCSAISKQNHNGSEVDIMLANKSAY